MSDGNKDRVNYARDFIGGVDPFGAWTGGYGGEAQRKNRSESVHRKKLLASALGGVVGGAVLVPAAIGGSIGAMKGLSKGKGIGGRLTSAVNGMVSGSQEPIQKIVSGKKSLSALQRIKANPTDVVSDVDIKTLKNTPGLSPELRGSVSELNGPNQVEARAMVPKAHEKLREAVSDGYTQMGLGGVVGSVGAAVQYQKGRSSERAFGVREEKALRDQRRRLGMGKVSSVAYAECYSELEKIASLSNVGSTVGKYVQSGVDLVGDIGRKAKSLVVKAPTPKVDAAAGTVPAAPARDYSIDGAKKWYSGLSADDQRKLHIAGGTAVAGAAGYALS